MIRPRSAALIVGIGAAIFGLGSSASGRTLDSMISVAVTASPNPAVFGENVAFKVTASNTGSTAATRVQLNNLYGGTLISASPSAGSCAAPRNSSYFSCALGSMPVGSSQIVTVVVSPAADGQLTYTAWAAADQTNSNSVPRTQTIVNVRPAPEATPPANPTVGIGGWEGARPFQLSRSFLVIWNAVDPAIVQEEAASYDVRVRDAPLGQPFGPYRTFATPSSSQWSAVFDGTPGHTYCFSVQAADLLGKLSAWSPEACTAVPLPVWALRRNGQCVVRQSTTAYLGKHALCRGSSSTLATRIAGARRVAVVFERCPACGTAVVRWNGRVVDRTVLSGAGAAPLIVPTHIPAPASGLLVIQPLTAHSRIVVDGVGISATP
jgi:uncharacterized repeat protein (TIGR01451 family)